MKVYKPLIADNYQFFQTDSLDHFEMLQERNYMEINSTKFLKTTIKRNLLGNITIIDNSMLLAFSQQAIKVYNTAGNFIPFSVKENYSLFEPPIIDALDFGKSMIDYFMDTHELKRIREYVFLVEKIKNVDAFSLPLKSSPVFVTESFITKYNNNNFCGLEFSLVFTE